MRKHILVVCTFVALAAWTAGAYGDVVASSFFDSTDEGWLVTGDVQGQNSGTATPDFLATDGQPVGCVHATDTGVGGTWYWMAPAKFLGDVDAAYGGTLSYDLKTTHTGSWTRPDLILYGNGTELRADMGTSPGTDWTSYTIPITAGTWHFAGGGDATAQEITDVLANLTGLWIRGEFFDGNDQGYLDNVVLTAGPAPEPATLALLALGGIGLLRRRSR